MTLSHTGKVTNASNQMARNFSGPWLFQQPKHFRRCHSQSVEGLLRAGYQERKRAMLWIFQVFALSAGLYVKFGIQILSRLKYAYTKPTTFAF